jgi:hypothetical protein
MKSFINSFRSEWLKRKGSLASWLVVCGAFFTPTIIIVAKIFRHGGLAVANLLPDYWERLWSSAWESMAIFLLPLGAILASSLITQIEYKNNSWKLLHTTPQSYRVIFLAKLAVILIMMLQFLLFFNAGIYMAGVLPGLLFGIPYPKEPIPFTYFIKEDIRYFIACMPIVALQYLISLRFKNFLVPVGSGIALWILSVAVLSWKYGYLIPYTYCSFNFLKGHAKFIHPPNLLIFASGYFILFIIMAYILYLQQKEKGLMKKHTVIAIHLSYWTLFALLLLTFFFFAVFVPAHSHPITQGGTLLGWMKLMLAFAILPGLLSFYLSYFYLFGRLLSRRKIAAFLFVSGIAALLFAFIIASIATLPFAYGRAFLFNDGYHSALIVLLMMTGLAWLNGVAGAVIKACLTWYQEIRLKEELHRKNLETELALVKSQMDPHFLFNSLNNIDVMIGKDAATASLYLNKLSGMMRFLLYETKSGRIPIETELNYLQQYIDLQRIRTSNQNYVSFEQTVDMAGQHIAPMILLPFIENAFKYTESNKTGSRIDIRLNLSYGQLYFSCSNTIVTSEDQPSVGGLGNGLISKRLELLYPKKHNLKISVDELTYSVKLELTL